MHDNTAIGGWDDVRKPWNLGFSYETKMIVFSTLFLVEIRYILLKRLAMEHEPATFCRRSRTGDSDLGYLVGTRPKAQSMRVKHFLRRKAAWKSCV